MNILKKILSEKSNTLMYISEFQNHIWDGLNYSDNEEVNEILKSLAYDLDYFEENEEFRLENSIYYGYDKLVNEIELAIAKIEKIEKNKN